MVSEPSRFRVRLAISGLFLIPGLLAGAWFVRIPAVMAQHDLRDTGQVGLVLLSFSLGALVVFQVAGRLIARYGSSRVATTGGVAMCVVMALLALAPSPILLAGALFAMGLAIGGQSVARNAKGVTTERHLGHRIMGSLHGCFTVGILIGSAIGGLAARAGIQPPLQFAVMAAIGLAIVLAAHRDLLPDPATAAATTEKERHVLFSRTLLPLGIMAFCASLSEGAMYDWSALYVHRDLGASEATGAYAFAAFSLAVLVGRFGGDRVIDRLGAANVVRLGSAIAGTGLIIGLAIDTIPAVVGGIAALGLGVSLLTPMFYSAAGSREGVSSAQAVAAVATCGMLGLLAGPPLLGNLASVTSLRLALLVVAIPCATMIVLAENVGSRSRDMPAPPGAPNPS